MVNSERKEPEHKPTKFAYLGVGQAVPAKDIAEFATELFPNHKECTLLALIQAQEIAEKAYGRVPDFELTTDLFNSDSPSFQRTDFVQPGTLELCAEAVEAANLEQDGKPIIPDFYAGHSLGSVFAAYLAGVITSREQLREIGAFRGMVMQEAYEKTHTTLLSVQGLTEEVVAKILPPYAGIGLVNAPTLIAVGLLEDKDKIAEVSNILKETGKQIRITPLKTKGAFHVAMYMEKATEQMGRFLEPYDFADMITGEFVANSDGRRLTKGSDIKQELVHSMVVPVRYPDMLRTMTGVDGFIEIGPGKVLSTLNNLNNIPKSYTLHIRNYLISQNVSSAQSSYVFETRSNKSSDQTSK